MGLTDEIRRVIISHKWKKFCRHTNPYNMQIVKELYSNMVDIYQNALKVIVRGTKVQYSEGTINMALGVKSVETPTKGYWK